MFKAGLIGYWPLQEALKDLSEELASRAKLIEEETLLEMIWGARLLAPHDTGLLHSGIVGENHDGVFEFSAFAQHKKANGKLGADYAPFVEYGTEPHFQRSATPEDSSAFASARRRRLGKKYQHPGADPEPFFWPAVDFALAGRRRKFDDVIEESAKATGFETK